MAWLQDIFKEKISEQKTSDENRIKKIVSNIMSAIINGEYGIVKYFNCDDGSLHAIIEHSSFEEIVMPKNSNIRDIILNKLSSEIRTYCKNSSDYKFDFIKLPETCPEYLTTGLLEMKLKYSDEAIKRFEQQKYYKNQIIIPAPRI